MNLENRKVSNKFMCVFLIMVFPLEIFAQNMIQPEPGWHLKDLKTDGVFGISIEKAARELLSGKRAKPVTVAVLDGGVDVKHRDLRDLIWTNPKEKAGNGKDDDGNGFIDDVHGWNFYSSMGKGDEEFEIRELFLQARQNPAIQEQLDKKLLPYRNKVKAMISDKKLLLQMLQKIGKLNPAVDDFRNYIPVNNEELRVQKEMVQGLMLYPAYVSYRLKQLDRAADHYKMELSYYEHQDYDLVTGGPTSFHGTHISGTVAMLGNNGKKIKGLGEEVRLMVLRTIRGIDPTGSNPMEPQLMVLANAGPSPNDQAIASAIRYAVNNGAKVINMSFGLPGSFNSPIIMEAVKYAVTKDVLLVHASGNQGINIDEKETFSNRKTAEGLAIAECWIEVGASGWKDDAGLAAVFSNYGKTSVDVYAPGVDIYSTAPRSVYLSDSGTSMAAPTVTGLAAILKAYYPQLTAIQLKEIIMKSVVKRDVLKDKCISGGVVNAFNAFILAEKESLNKH